MIARINLRFRSSEICDSYVQDLFHWFEGSGTVFVTGIGTIFLISINIGAIIIITITGVVGAIIIITINMTISISILITGVARMSDMTTIAIFSISINLVIVSMSIVVGATTTTWAASYASYYACQCRSSS